MELFPGLRVAAVAGLGVDRREFAEAGEGNLAALEELRSHDAAQGGKKPLKLRYGIRSVMMNGFAFLPLLDEFGLGHDARPYRVEGWVSGSGCSGSS